MRVRILLLVSLLCLKATSYAQTENRHIQIVDSLTPQEKSPGTRLFSNLNWIH